MSTLLIAGALICLGLLIIILMYIVIRTEEKKNREIDKMDTYNWIDTIWEEDQEPEEPDYYKEKKELEMLDRLEETRDEAVSPQVRS